MTVCNPERFELDWLFVVLDLLKLDHWAPKLKFPKSFVGGGSYLPLDQKGSGGGGWNGLKPDEPNPGFWLGLGPGPGPGSGLKSKNGGEIGLTGEGAPPVMLLLLLLFFGNLVMPVSLSSLFLTSNSLPGWLGKFLIRSLSVPFF